MSALSQFFQQQSAGPGGLAGLVFGNANRQLPNGGGSYSSPVPPQQTSGALPLPASTAAATVPGAGTSPAASITPDTSGADAAPGSSSTAPTGVTPTDFATLLNGLQSAGVGSAVNNQGNSANILSTLTGVNNLGNSYATGGSDLFAGQNAGTPFTADELNAIQSGEASILQPDTAALGTKLANAEEQDVYTSKNTGKIVPPSFTSQESQALSMGGSGANAAGLGDAFNSATAKIVEAQKQALDSQRYGYTQSIYGLGGANGKVDTTNLAPVTNGPGDAAFVAGGADGTAKNQNYGTPAYVAADGTPLDAAGNPWPTNNTYANINIQQKLSDQYVTALQKASSSRSGDLGTQNAKVSSAIHAQSLIDQATDPSTGNINLSSSQYQELASSVANLLSGGNSGTDSQISGLMAPTLQGSVNKIISYVSGDPQNATTQANLKLLAQTIQRQGETAQQLRDADLDEQAIIPSGMDPARALQDKSQASFPSFTSYSTGGPAGTNPFAAKAPAGAGSTSSTDPFAF